MQNKKRFFAIPSSNKREGSVNISSRAEHPFNLFSPFSYSSDYAIPVPGMKGSFSHSVEGIWQGLKVINGELGEELFKRRPVKRQGIPEGHLFGSELISLIEARHKIYRPSYFFHLENNIPKELKELICRQAIIKPVYFYDVEENVEIEDPSSPLAHSFFAAEFFNEYLSNSSFLNS